MLPMTGMPLHERRRQWSPVPVCGGSGQSPTKLVKRSTPMVLYMERT